jgi:hypothetical protein
MHPISPDVPSGRESFAWAVPIPHEDLLAFLYLARDAATGRYTRMVALADGMSREPLYRDIAAEADMESGTDFDDCQVAGLTLRQPEPLTTAELSYAGDGVRVEVAIRALHEPFSWHDNKDGCAGWIATDRYEQSVTTRGTIEVGGRTVRFEGMGHRDHSWGPRDWRPMQHWKWMNAATPDGTTSLHAFVIFALGDRLVNGYVNRGGKVSPLAAIDVRAELDLSSMLHRRVHAVCTDEDAQRIVLDATGVAGLAVPARHMRMNEVACTATLDDRPAIAHVEMGWPETYVREFTG